MAATAIRLELNWSASDVLDRLETGADSLRRIAHDLLAASPGEQQQRLILMIDQAEELFTRTAPTVQQQFAELLREAVAGPVRVVATTRSEFLDDLTSPSGLANTVEVYMLNPLDSEGLREIIEQPANVAGLKLEDGLTARLVADTGNGDALPLLAFVLRELAKGLAAGGTLQLDRYNQLGGVRGALARHADKTLAVAVQVSGLTEREVLTGLTRLVTIDENDRYGRRHIKFTDLPEPLRIAFQIFVDRRLLLSGSNVNRQLLPSDNDGEAIDTPDECPILLTVTHEALLTGWRPLEAAITDIAVALRARRTVEQAATEWVTGGRVEYYLWDDERLTIILTTLGISTGDGDVVTQSLVPLEPRAVAFLNASVRHFRAAQERERRRRIRTIVVPSMVLVLALVGAGIVLWQLQRTQEAQNTAYSRSMLAEADKIRDQDPRRALQLGVAANQLDPSPQTQVNLRQTLTSTSHFRTLHGHTRAVYGVAVTPDGRTLATTSGDRTVRLWDLSNRDQPRQLGQPLTVGKEAANGAAFSSDGRTMATAHGDNKIRLWDISDRERPRQLGQDLTGDTEDWDWVFAVTFAPDGHTLASTGRNKKAILWDLTNLDQPRRIGEVWTGQAGAVNEVAFAPDGHTLATAGDTVRLWDISDHDQPKQLGQPLDDHTGAVYSVAFAPDGRTLATASVDRSIRVWDLTDRDRPRQLGQPLTGHNDQVNEVVFAPDGHTIASISADNTVRLWNLDNRDRPQALGQPLRGHTGGIVKLAFTPDGRTLATASLDQTAILWDLADHSQARQIGQPLTDHAGAVMSMTFAPDGRTLATVGNAIRLWDFTDRDRAQPLGQPLTDPEGSVNAVVFSADGRTLATAHADSTVRLWDLTDRNQPRPLGQPISGPAHSLNTVAISPDSRTLVSTGDDQNIKFWDLGDRDRPRLLGQPINTHHIQEIAKLAYSPDERILATASLDQTIKLWDVTDRDRPRQLSQDLKGHRDAVNTVSFSQDGKTMVTASSDHTAILWDLSDRDRPRQFGQTLTGHELAVKDAALAPSGRILATVSDDRTVRLWDLTDRHWSHQLLQPLRGHDAEVNAVAFAPDGRTLATADANGTIILWDVPHLDGFPSGDVGEACIRVGGSLDQTTWEQYAPNASYQDVCAGR